MPDHPTPLKCWVCPNCGQMYFGDHPPDMCDFCADFTTWQPVNFPQPHPSELSKNEEDPPQQPPLFDTD